MGSYSAMYPVVSCPVSSVVITQPLTTTTIRSNTLEALVHNPPKETAIRLEPKVLHNCQHIKHTCRKVENGDVNNDNNLASSVVILEQNQNVLNGVIKESEINRCQLSESKDDRGIVNPSMNPEQKEDEVQDVRSEKGENESKLTENPGDLQASPKVEPKSDLSDQKVAKETLGPTEDSKPVLNENVDDQEDQQVVKDDAKIQEKCSLSLDLQVDEKWKNPGLDELSPIEEFTLLCRRLSILPEEGEDCLSNSSNENWNFASGSNPKNHQKNSFRRTHSEEKDSHSISQQSNSVHQYNKNKFSSKSMDRIAGIVTTSSDSSPSARSTSR